MLYRHCLVYIQIFVAISILSGIWGVVMCVRTAECMGIVFRPRFLALQLVLIIVKLQYGLAKLLSDSVTLPCITSLHPTILVNGEFYHFFLYGRNINKKKLFKSYLFYTLKNIKWRNNENSIDRPVQRCVNERCNSEMPLTLRDISLLK